MSKNRQNSASNKKNPKTLLLSTKLMLFALLICVLVISYYVFHFELLSEIFPKKQNILTQDNPHANLIQHNVSNIQKSHSGDEDESEQEEVLEDKSLNEDDVDANDDSSAQEGLIDHAKKLLPALSAGKSETDVTAQAPESQIEGDNNLEEQLNAYNNFLLSIQYLILNFVQDKEYSKYLRILKNHNLNLPDDIEITISMLSRYNNELKKTTSSQSEQITFTKIPFVNKLITITKDTNESRSKKRLKADILSNIDRFIRYMYSKNVQSVFMNSP